MNGSLPNRINNSNNAPPPPNPQYYSSCHTRRTIEYTHLQNGWKWKPLNVLNSTGNLYQHQNKHPLFGNLTKFHLARCYLSQEIKFQFEKFQTFVWLGVCAIPRHTNICKYEQFQTVISPIILVVLTWNFQYLLREPCSFLLWGLFFFNGKFIFCFGEGSLTSLREMLQ